MDKFEELAIQMCKQISLHSNSARIYSELAVVDPRVLAVMQQVPRHEFVPYNFIEEAYIDAPLSIGYAQTISQPYIVALMTSLLQPQTFHKVLEVGTGSGYQAAILSKFVERVYTLEAIPELAQQAAARFTRLQFNNISYSIKSGREGWPEFAPFDSIIVTAAATEIPNALVDQLKTGGKMVIPLEDQFGAQELFLIQKHSDLSISKLGILPVRFVPLRK